MTNRLKRERREAQEVIDDALDEMREDAEIAQQEVDEWNEFEALNAQYVEEDEQRYWNEREDSDLYFAMWNALDY
jgi:hypothetical protein